MSNGREVVDYIPDHHVSVALMDVQMPVLDEVSALRKIRAMRGNRSKTPVTAMTANVLIESQRDMIYAGIKPFRQAELREALHKAIEPNAPALQ